MENNIMSVCKIYWRCEMSDVVRREVYSNNYIRVGLKNKAENKVLTIRTLSPRESSQNFNKESSHSLSPRCILLRPKSNIDYSCIKRYM